MKLRLMNANPVKVLQLGAQKHLIYEPFFLSMFHGHGKIKEAEYQELFDGLRFFKSKIETDNARLAVVAFPNKLLLYDWLLPEDWRNHIKKDKLNLLRKVCHNLDIPFLDIETELKPIAKKLYYTKGLYLFWRDDIHPSYLGNVYIARFVYNFINKISLP